jgi:putative Mg2+ transporter-C (MgtC) family protein
VDGWWQDAMDVIRHEFSDLPNVAEFTRTCVRLSMAIVLGGILGYERELAGSAAGFRTHMLVALGSALFVLVPLQAGISVVDMSRVLQGVVAGIGFLGAGAIIKHGQGMEIHGLTTAASIWLTCAIGIAAGMGREMTAIVSTLFALVILLLVRVIKTPDHPGAGNAPK